MIDNAIAESIQKVFEKKGYAFFTHGDYNLNLLGIRRNNTWPNEFDDFFVAVYKVQSQWVVDWFWCTTDAGLFYLQNPIVEKGCALLKEGQYRGGYQLGLHRNSYEALVQRKPVTVYRDNNRNKTLDFNAPTETGMFGINIHKGSDLKSRDYLVDKYSAGCQVIQDANEFKHLLQLCRQAARRYGNSFTYTLINEKDFADVSD